jgi:hypothetical protein
MKLTAETTIFNDDKVQQKFSELIVDADGIHTEVSKKVGNDEVISRINQSAEEVKIQASKVEVDGTLIVGKSAVDSAKAEAISAGEKTATNYITAIDENGIRVHPSATENNFVAINSDGMEVFKDDISVAMYGDESRLGDAEGYHTTVSSSAIELKKANDTMFQVMATGEMVNVQNTQMLLRASRIKTGTSRSTSVILNPNVDYAFSMYSSPARGFRYSFTADSASTATQSVTSADGKYTMTASYVKQYETVNGVTKIAHVKATITEKRTSTSYPYPTVGYVYTTDIDESAIHFFGNNNVLWSGEHYMTEVQTIELSESVSSQLNGIVLVWSNYTEGEAYNYDWHYTFIPKYHVFNSGGTGISCGVWGLNAQFNTVVSKYVYVSNTEITGYSANSSAGTGASGIKYDNTRCVLRYVLGV